MSAPTQTVALTARSYFMLYLDALLLLVLFLLLAPRLTGLPIHEILGIVFVLPILIHLLIARPWIQLAAGRLLSSGTRARVNFMLNSILFVLVLIEIFSGLEISQVALPSLGMITINDQTWRELHNQTLDWTKLVVGFHIAMNWKWIVAVIHRRAAKQKSTDVVIARTYGAAMLWIGLVSLVSVLLAAGLVLIFGPPDLSRLSTGNEIARFAPTFWHGVIQFFSQQVLIALVVYAGRNWFKIRL